MKGVGLEIRHTHRLSGPAISQFNADAGGEAMLVAYWSLISEDGRTVMSRKRSAITEKAASGDLAAIVAAQNQTLLTLSREIAAEIQKNM